MTGVAKTVADCLKYRNKIGLDVALEALREAWGKKRMTSDGLCQGLPHGQRDVPVSGNFGMSVRSIGASIRDRLLLAPNSPWREAITSQEELLLEAEAVVPEPYPAPAASDPFPYPARYLWAALLARIFEIFPMTCTHCGGEIGPSPL